MEIEQLSHLARLLALPLLVANKAGSHRAFTGSKPAQRGVLLTVDLAILTRHWQEIAIGLSELSRESAQRLMSAIYQPYLISQSPSDGLDVLAFYGDMAKVFFRSTGDNIRLTADDPHAFLPMSLTASQGVELYHQITLHLGSDFLLSRFIADLPQPSRNRILTKGAGDLLDTANSRITGKLYQEAVLCDCHLHKSTAFNAERCWSDMLGKVQECFLEPQAEALYFWGTLLTPQHFLAALLRQLLQLATLQKHSLQITADEFNAIAQASVLLAPEARQQQFDLARNHSALFAENDTSMADNRHHDAGSMSDPFGRFDPDILIKGGDIWPRLLSLMHKNDRRLHALQQPIGTGHQTDNQRDMVLQSQVFFWLLYPEHALSVKHAQHVARLAWWYLQLKAGFCGQFRQRPAMAGLEYFNEIFARNKLIQPVQQPLLAQANRLEQHLSPNKRVNYLELRVSPDVDNLYPILQQVQKFNTESDTCTIKLVVHYAKWSRLGRPSPFSQQPHTLSLVEAVQELYALTNDFKELFVICRTEKLHLEVVGLDVAGPESYRPNWLYLPVFEEMRPWWRNQFGEDNGFGYTFHCGEDFLHLHTGLRRIYEIVQFFPWETGDRLGHALALGMDIHGWLARKMPALAPIDEQLMDLIWEWQLLSSLTLPELGQLGHAAKLEQEIKRLGKQLLGDAHLPQADDYVQWYQALFNPALVNRLMAYPVMWQTRWYRKQPSTKTNQSILAIEQAVQKYFQRIDMANIEEAPYQFDALENLAQQRLTLLQSWLTERISEKGFAIEACPSSNTTISRLPNMAQHPLFGLQQRIPVLISTDNPLVNNTDLVLEFRKIFESEIERHGDYEQAQKLIRGYLNNAETYRFWRGKLKSS